MPSFIIIGYVWQILGRGAFLPPPHIREQLQKCPSRIGLINNISFSGQISQKRLDFFKIGIHSMQGWIATTRHGVKRKRSTKKLKHTGNLFRNNIKLKDDFYSRLKATKIIGQRKAFCRQYFVWGKELLTYTSL